MSFNTSNWNQNVNKNALTRQHILPYYRSVYCSCLIQINSLAKFKAIAVRVQKYDFVMFFDFIQFHKKGTLILGFVQVFLPTIIQCISCNINYNQGSIRGWREPGLWVID